MIFLRNIVVSKGCPKCLINTLCFNTRTRIDECSQSSTGRFVLEISSCFSTPYKRAFSEWIEKKEKEGNAGP